jgi:RNA polymerase sigma-70 factor (ECF subfamily)
VSDPDQNAADWLFAARAGSVEALGQAFEACRGYLLLIAQRELDADLRAKGGASDLVQETFVEVQRDFKNFQGDSEAELLAWLRRLLLNNVGNFARHYQGTAKRRTSREVVFGGDSSIVPCLTLAAPQVTPSGEVVAQERADAVRKALERLPDDYRQVLVLRYQEDRTFAEIGELMGRSGNAIRKLWLRAVERIQQELGDV